MKWQVLFSCLLLVFGYTKARPLNDFNSNSQFFSDLYRCYSALNFPGNERQDVEKGGRIIMPPSALDKLARLNIEYPMFFRLINSQNSRLTHVGVLEFVADEGKIYIPSWMMQNLQLEEGDIVQIESTSLPAAEFTKFKPQSVDFLEITDHKAVLESVLGNFACLTAGDLIPITYNSKIYELLVLETNPTNAVSIIDVDLNVDFDAPVGYVEPERVTKPNDEMNEQKTDANEQSQNVIIPSNPFSGKGKRLNGGKKDDKPKPPSDFDVRGVPDYNHPFGLISFDRSVEPISDRTEQKSNGKENDAFKGKGSTVRKNRKE